MRGALIVILIAGAVYFFLVKKQTEKTLEVTEKGIAAIEKTRQTAQFADWSYITQALSHYLTDHGSYPDNLEDLIPNYLHGRHYLNDSWGTPIRYQKEAAGITLISAGPDREMGTGDDLTKTI